MTREQLEQAIEDNLDSISFDSEGNARHEDGSPATELDLKRALAEHHRLKRLLRHSP
jgi:hypothetical protein